MSGMLQAHANTATNGQLSVVPAACPLASHMPSGDRVSCLTYDMWGQEHQCPYLLGLTHPASFTRRLDMDMIRRHMTERAMRQYRCAVRCSEARPTVPPGA